MHKAQSLQQPLDSIREYSSPPCWMHEVDPSYLGYWSREEIIAFLESLLDRERIGTSAGMPRRIVDYPDAFADLNQISSIGSYISATGLIVFFVGLAYAFVRKERAADSPWGPGASTLEWTRPSPPPFHQFEVLPRIE